MQKIYLHNQEIAVPKHSLAPKGPFCRFFPAKHFSYLKLYSHLQIILSGAVPCFLSSLRLLLLIH